MVKYHKHIVPYGDGWGFSFGETQNRNYGSDADRDSDNVWMMTNDGSDYNAIVNEAGLMGNENRPKNIAVMFIIKGG